MVIVLMVIVSSCKPTENFTEKQNAAMDSWVGSHKSEIILQKGPPDRVASDGLDGEILIWEGTRTITSGGSAWPTVDGKGYIYTAPVTVTKDWYRMYYVNSSGIIYSWRWKE